jgi:hypothetical protein
MNSCIEWYKLFLQVMTGRFFIVQNQVENHNLEKVKRANVCRAQLSPENINFHTLESFLCCGPIHIFTDATPYFQFHSS